MKINREWHFKYPMPAKATFEQRAQWHLNHQVNCACRPIPEKLAAEIKDKGFKLNDIEQQL